MPGFNDSGAHIRNMAFHDGALHMLRMAARDPQWMSPVRSRSLACSCDTCRVHRVVALRVSSFTRVLPHQ